MAQPATDVVLADQPPRGRLIAGAATLVVGLSIKVLGSALVLASSLSAERKALLTGVMFIATPKCSFS